MSNAGIATALTAKGNPVNLEIATDYPLSGNVIIKVSPESPEEFSIRLRIPAWNQRTSLKINEETIAVILETYAEINRKWMPGDKIELNLDMRCRIIDVPDGSNRAGDNFKALVRGSTVLTRNETIDENYNQSVTIISKDGYVDVSIETPTVESTRMQFSSYK